MKKKIAIISGMIVLLLLLFFPIKAQLDDGGTVIYMSIAKIYEIRKIKTYGNVGMTLTMKEGLSVKLFGKEVYSHIDTEYLAEQKDWGDANGTCYFDAKIVEMTEDKIVLESMKEGIGPICPETPVAFDIIMVSDKIRDGLWIGDEIRVMYNDKRVRVENPLWLEVVFAVYPLDENGEVISESGTTLHQGFRFLEPTGILWTPQEAYEIEDVWMMYTKTPYSSIMLVDGKGTATLSLKKTLEAYPVDTPPEEILAAVKEENYVVFEDLRLTSGSLIWKNFCEKVQKKENAQIKLAKYCSLGEENPYALEFYELKKKEYPKVDFYSLVYVAGEGFWLGCRTCTEEASELVRCYNYMKHFGGDTAAPGSLDSQYDRYVLVDDDSVTWEDIMKQMLSSVHTEDDIVWQTVYCNYIE